MCKKSHSEHIFLFPFAWEVQDATEEYLFRQHQQIKGKLFEHIKGWEKEYLTIDKDADYNEFVYFYKPVRAALYTKEKTPIITLNYKHEWLKQSGEVEIHVEENVYRLELYKITLKLYKSGVGILSMNLRNNHYPLAEEIMEINSFSKCIYPSVLPIEKSWQDIYPKYLKVTLDEIHQVEDYFREDYKANPGCISKIIMYLLGEQFTCDRKKLFRNKILIEPVIGSRMITLCLYQNNQMVEEVSNKRIKEEDLQKFILMTKKEQHIGKISYLSTPYRIYAMSMSTLMCITSSNVESKVYDQLVSLVLAQKATLLNFSSQIATISTLPKNDLVPAIQSIYEIYIQFINQMYFDEITEDIQGAMIYKMFMEQLNIKEELKQLDFEMKEVHEYAELIDQTQSRLKADLLTIVGAALVVPTFVTGFFGMNILEEKFTSWWQHKEIALWFNSYVMLPVLSILLVCIWNKNRGKKYRIIRAMLIMAIIINVIIICVYGCGLK